MDCNSLDQHASWKRGDKYGLVHSNAYTEMDIQEEISCHLDTQHLAMELSCSEYPVSATLGKSIVVVGFSLRYGQFQAGTQFGHQPKAEV